MPPKTREIKKVENELRVLEGQKAVAVQGGREAIDRRDNNVNGGDELEIKGTVTEGCGH